MRVGGLAGPNAPGPCHDSRNACAAQHAARKIRESAAAGHWAGSSRRPRRCRRRRLL